MFTASKESECWSNSNQAAKSGQDSQDDERYHHSSRRLVRDMNSVTMTRMCSAVIINWANVLTRFVPRAIPCGFANRVMNR